MTESERIEAAAKAMVKLCTGRLASTSRLPTRIEEAQAALRAAFPELFSSPPTHWLAPWEASDEMIEASYRDDFPREPASIGEKWVLMRTAHLNPATTDEAGNSSGERRHGDVSALAR